MFLTQIHYGTKHNIQRSRRALEGGQETVCQEINLRSLLPAHSEPSATGTGGEGGCPGRGRSRTGEPETCHRPQPENRQGHPCGPKNDSPIWR